MPSQYARARTWLASAEDDWLLPLSKVATEELIAEHDELVKALRKIIAVNARIRPSTGEVDYHGAWGDCESIARNALAKVEA